MVATSRKVIRPFKKQIEAKITATRPDKTIILYGGAIRGGKSYWLILMFHSFCIQYPGSKWLLLRESGPTLERTLIPTFDKLCDQGLHPYIQSFNRKSLEVTYHNGSKLIFMAENYDHDKDLNRFRGLEINGAGVDELNEIQEETFNKLIERSGSHIMDDMPPIKILATCNPSNNWVKKKFYDRHVEGTLPASWEYIPAKITDNPHVPEAYLKSLEENMTPDNRRKFVEGDWNVIIVDNPFASEYNADKHESLNAIFRPEIPIRISIDFNLNPFAVTFSHIWRDKEGEHAHVFDELSIAGGSIPKMVDAIKSRYGPYLYRAEITGDYMGAKGDISQRDNASLYLQLIRGLGMSKAQLKLSPNPTHENSRADVNYVLFRFPDFKINPKTCPSTCMDMRTVQVDAFGSIIKRNRNDLTQRADHLDTIRYLINRFLKPWILTSTKNSHK
jgi:hypothetical protein